MKHLVTLLFVLTFVICALTLTHAAEFDPPLGMPPVPVPADNPMTLEKVELGKMLYFDKRLSKDNTISCATCHDPKNAYAEPKPVSEGVDGQKGNKNAPTVINSAYISTMFHDGREKDLEGQAGGPVENPIEMGSKFENCQKIINGIPEYKKRFGAVFGEPASKDTITKAIAAFERTILSGNSPYDKYMAGDKNAMSADALAGMKLFNGRALCATCHTPPVFSNGNFINTGIESDQPGRMAVTGVPEDKGKWRVPHLREVEHTAPYFHNGSVSDLKEAVRFMADGGKENPGLYPLFKAMPKLSDQQIDQLVAFLKSLSGEYPIVAEPKLP